MTTDDRRHDLTSVAAVDSRLYSLPLMPYKDVAPPAGEKITRTDKLNVPDQPVIPFIRGDGTGPDIWAASVRVFDAAVEKAYGGRKKISWFEVYAGQAAKDKFGEWLPEDTVEAFREYHVGIKGPLTTPVGGGIRSLNVALRQLLDLFVCLRPVQYFDGVPSPLKHPEKVNMVIFRENTEDIYAGIEFAAGTPDAQKVLDFLKKDFPQQLRENPLRDKTESGGVLEKSRGTGKGRRLRRDRNQTGQSVRHRSPGAQRDLVCDCEPPQERDAGPQGQHHEIHRRRFPRLGL